MINLLIDYEDGDVFKEVLDSVDEEGNRLYPHSYSKVSEMDDSWMVVCMPEDVTILEEGLKLPPLRLVIIGTYNEDGSQYIWTLPQEIQRNHSINKYKTKLKDIKEYDEEGNETSSRRPTEAEALNTQVNNIYGWNKRVLN